MKKILVGIGVAFVLLLGLVVTKPQLLFLFSITQPLALQLEGGQVATFYFSKNVSTKDTLYMKGVIYSNTLSDIRRALHENPQVTTLVMEHVPGSIDDDINLLASREIRKRNINTYVPKNGMVASGGTDMFLAGVNRAAHPTAKIGVHSWGGFGEAATALPKDHSEHQKYLEYYREMNIPEAFYWYTLKAASADAMHWMTAEERINYSIVSPKTLFVELLDLQKILASDAFAGRGTGANEKAQDLIRNYFKKQGLLSFNKEYNSPFTFQDRRTQKARTGNNLIGFVHGKKHPDQYIVIGAHYDHMGVVNGTIFNGADDNASGTAALLVLAKYFTKYPPEHSIIFAAFDAEELGLHGSIAFVKKPPVSLSKIKLNINFDMISRNSKNEIYVVGTHQYPQFKPLVELAAQKAKLKVSYGHDDPKDTTKDYWMESSDNGSFFKVGIPNITFSEEDHPDYHKATDDVERIHPEFYKEVFALIQRSIKNIDTNFPKTKR